MTIDLQKIEWRGWLIHATNWHAPLYVAGEMPPGHIGWTAKEDEALGFKKKAEAQEFMDRIPNHCGMEYELRFHPWRFKPDSTRTASAR